VICRSCHVRYRPVEIGFHPIPLGVWGKFGGGNKKKERERLWEINHIFFALLYSSGQPKPATLIVAERVVEIVQFCGIIFSFGKGVDCTFFGIFS
jgi:hypothetical protein